jgi:PPP family 3-phenylpropionic acid transporter
MSYRPDAATDDGFARRTALFYAAYFVFAGLHLPFLPVWLEARGLDAAEIGIVLAAGMAARPLVVPVATRLADRRGWLKGPLVAATWATAASMLLLQASHGFVPILAANALASLAFALILPFADAFALRGLTARGRAYGPVRLWGSVTFIVANVGGGLLLERLGAGNIVWALTAAMLATALAASLLRPLGGTSAVAAPATAGASLWGSRTFVAVVAIGSVVQSSHAVLYGFASLQWAARGLDGFRSAPCGGSAWWPRSACSPCRAGSPAGCGRSTCWRSGRAAPCCAGA